MARVDLTVEQLTLVCRVLEEHTGRLREDTDYPEMLALSVVYVALLKACKASLDADNRAWQQEYGEVKK